MRTHAASGVPTPRKQDHAHPASGPGPASPDMAFGKAAGAPDDRRLDIRGIERVALLPASGQVGRILVGVEV
jgi:hypothetical protein